MMLGVQNGLCMQQYIPTTYLHAVAILQANYSQQALLVSVTD